MLWQVCSTITYLYTEADYTSSSAVEMILSGKLYVLGFRVAGREGVATEGARL